MKEKFGVKHIVKVLNNFLFLAKLKEICQQYLSVFQRFCNMCGIPLAPHKTEGPVTCVFGSRIRHSFYDGKNTPGTVS